MIRNYIPEDEKQLLELWNTVGVGMGYVPMTEASFRAHITEHPDFSPEFAFVLEEKGEVLSFLCGCTGEHIPRGKERGYITCLLLKDSADCPDNARMLLERLEAAFREAGRTHCVVNFFNPMHLPWFLPDTPGHQHNNMPGIPKNGHLYSWMMSGGYREITLECAMYLNLAEYETPVWVEEKAVDMAAKGYTVARYDPKAHIGLQKMVDALGNPQWSAEIPAAGEQGMDLLVGLHGNACAGFAGPVYPEETGRGYFSGIGVAPQFERNGLGTLLFYRLLEREKAAGARYMSLFTGIQNPAKQIYEKAGFRQKRIFAVMDKEL